MTLLVTVIHLPDISRQHIATELLQAMGAEWRQFTSYAISFLTIASYWLLHHSIYASVRRLDKVLLWLNILLLLTVTFLPFAAGVMGKYGRDSSTALLYGLTVSLSYLLLCLITTYLYHHPELGPGQTPPFRKSYILLRFALPLTLLMTGELLSFVHTQFSFALYLCVPLVSLLTANIKPKRHLKEHQQTLSD